jgi:hypothetical protein
VNYPSGRGLKHIDPICSSGKRIECIEVKYSPQIFLRIKKKFKRAAGKVFKRIANMCRRTARFIAARLPGGDRFRSLLSGFEYFFKKGSRLRFSVASFCFLGFVFGQSLTVRLFGALARRVGSLDLSFLNNSVSARRACASSSATTDPFDGLSDYEPEGILYHLTPVGNLESIRREGLRAPRGFVFLTDDLSSQDGYLKWKTRMLKKDTVFCVLKIDAKRLAQVCRLFFYNENRMVTKRVDPEFILNI